MSRILVPLTLGIAIGAQLVDLSNAQTSGQAAFHLFLLALCAAGVAAWVHTLATELT